ncbi:hypothetical protein [Pseudomonas sp. S4_EA_1b]|uniref:hypothetical protein n=1 Tax=Pseudomonas sp. S4_EA_1b TaxID=2796960 RepID=UPI0018E61298|nr:hypothetical protein [Pseudomonas sp. S4_EA_1b]MBI6601026.1 hypothetical protein [Pseudomonas sp. S4_EA_1b]
MTPKLLLMLTIGYAIALGLFFGWRKNLKHLALWGLIGATLIEVGATAFGFNKGISDTLLKQLMIVFGIGFPVFLTARHASIWKGICKEQAQVRKLKKSPSTFIFQAIGLTNLWLPALGLIITGLIMLYARTRAANHMPQLTDSARFQANISLMLIFGYILSAMPIGVYITSVILFYGAGKILVGFAVFASGYEYRYYTGKSLISKLQARLKRRRQAMLNQGL